MTRKDYILIADALHKSKPKFVVIDDPWPQIVHDVALALEQDNPRFDRDRFVAYVTK